MPDQFIDDNLKRLRQVSSRLEEEKLLRDLRADAVKAAYDKNGRVRFRLTGFAEARHPRGQPLELVVPNQ